MSVSEWQYGRDRRKNFSVRYGLVQPWNRGKLVRGMPWEHTPTISIPLGKRREESFLPLDVSSFFLQLSPDRKSWYRIVNNHQRITGNWYKQTKGVVIARSPAVAGWRSNPIKDEIATFLLVARNDEVEGDIAFVLILIDSFFESLLILHRLWKSHRILDTLLSYLLTFQRIQTRITLQSS